MKYHIIEDEGLSSDDFGTFEGDPTDPDNTT